jgi:hypothetical protein
MAEPASVGVGKASLGCREWILCRATSEWEKFMKIKANSIPADLLEKIKNPDPLEGEDILIEDSNGDLLGAILQPKAYEFFLKKVEEREDELDSALVESFDKDSKTLDDLLGE